MTTQRREWSDPPQTPRTLSVTTHCHEGEVIWGTILNILLHQHDDWAAELEEFYWKRSGEIVNLFTSYPETHLSLMDQIADTSNY